MKDKKMRVYGGHNYLISGADMTEYMALKEKYG
jgi:hypothetical protein